MRSGEADGRANPGVTRLSPVAFLIDQSASAITWTAMKLAAHEGCPNPPGWALDADGKPMMDPAGGLAGSAVPADSYEGFGAGLIVG